MTSRPYVVINAYAPKELNIQSLQSTSTDHWLEMFSIVSFMNKAHISKGKHHVELNSGTPVILYIILM